MAHGASRLLGAQQPAGAVSRGALRTNLTINFADGGSWAFEVSQLVGRMLVPVADALNYR